MAPSLKVIKGELKVAVMKREVTPPSRKVIKGESKAAVMKTEVEIPENSGQAIEVISSGDEVSVVGTSSGIGSSEAADFHMFRGCDCDRAACGACGQQVLNSPTTFSISSAAPTSPATSASTSTAPGRKRAAQPAVPPGKNHPRPLGRKKMCFTKESAQPPPNPPSLSSLELQAKDYANLRCFKGFPRGKNSGIQNENEPDSGLRP